MTAAERPSLQALEMHGTGTSLGDPIEMGAACAVIGQVRMHVLPLYLCTEACGRGSTDHASHPNYESSPLM